MADGHTPPPPGGLDPKDLLLADLQHFESAMARNEETGEKRFSFLVSLLTAVGGGLGALYTANDVDPKRVLQVGAGASLALAGLAFLTFLRLLHRNRVTDEHKRTLRHIRDTYRRLCPTLAAQGYGVPLSAPGTRAFRGGYAEMTGVVTAVLLGAWLQLWKQCWLASAGLAVAAAVALVLVAALVRRHPRDDGATPRTPHAGG